MNLYKKQKTKELKIEIENKFNTFPNSSMFVLNKYSEFEESFFDTFGNDLWVKITSEMFTFCIVNLLISGKINAVYFLDKKSILFNLFIFESEWFNIYPAQSLIIEDDDLLTNDILSILQKINPNEKESFTLLVNRVINIYLGAGVTKRSEKKFFYKYLNTYSMKHSWIKLKPNDKLLGLITNYEVEIDKDKRSVLIKSSNDFNGIKYQLIKKNVLFRNFLTYIEQIVSKDLRARYPSD